MGIRFYDDALYDKIQKWVKDPNMTILKPSETTRLFQQTLHQKDDKPITLPLISLSRVPEFEIQQTNKKPLTFDGAIMGSSSKTVKGVQHNKIIQLDAIPIGINYQLDIYTKRYEEGDEYLRNFIFNFINHPKLTITLPYNESNLNHVANVRVLSTITDNSDITEKLFSDQFTRWTILLEIDDAYLFNTPVKEPMVVDISSVDE